MKHSPEPWAFDNKVGLITHAGVGEKVVGSLILVEDMLRAIECVNACAGIQDPAQHIMLLNQALQYESDVGDDAINEVFKLRKDLTGTIKPLLLIADHLMGLAYYTRWSQIERLRYQKWKRDAWDILIQPKVPEGQANGR